MQQMGVLQTATQGEEIKTNNQGVKHNTCVFVGGSRVYGNSKNIHFIGWGREIITNKDKVQSNFQDIYCHNTSLRKLLALRLLWKISHILAVN